MTSKLRAARTALWHLRTGGLSQLRTHLRRRRILGPQRTPHRTADGAPVYEPWPVPEREPARPLRVGVILDEFSRLAFGYEWQQVLLKPSAWPEQLEGLDLVFVESAWKGNGGAWQYHLTGPTAPRPALVEMLAACRDRGVPTAFWNKEDPAHFEDFLDTARLFDRVYTTDTTVVPAYRERLGHDRVGVLPFGAQPAIHSPVRAHGHERSGDVAFAGTWFAHKYPERRAQMELLLGAAMDVSPRMEHGLEIFSRFAGQGDQYEFPEPFASRVVGSLGYDRMLAAYRDYKVFLNVNSVVDSPSMCARRIFEITACGTPVVTTPSAATGEFFPPDEVFSVATREEAASTIRALVRSPELRDRAVHRGQRRIWREHTYGARAQRVLHDVGLAAAPQVPRPSVTALVSTNRPHRLDDVLRTVGAQRDVAVQLALLTHGFEDDEADLRVRAKEAGVEDLVLLRADAGVPLGACLNRLVDAAGGDVVAKMDDDDVYGPLYLSDQLDAMAYSGAPVVGKQAHYMYLESLDATLLRFADREHRFTDRVMGPTIVARRDVAREVRFTELPAGEDTGFLAAAVEAGVRVYSADRFNFVQVRTGQRQHTWSVTDAELLASGEVQFYGRADEHVVF
ncbi:glycosyltransferase family protein [Puerhibacterium puerhi]|uniref:glycosyltransferase family protein n=1 Tax=Puerhibacterium puerhi TaxID=2692623 RepID=UPI001F17611C|nr:glycosyltransferase [Puerhibacterium puerhi]